MKTYIKATTVPNKKTDLIDDYKTDNAHTWSSEKIEEKLSYSTKEIIIGKWKEDKTLYRKIIETTTPTTSDFSYADYYEKTIDFYKNGETHIVNMYGMIFSDTNDMPMPYIASITEQDWGALYARTNAQQIVIHLGKGASGHFNKPIKIVVEYIK